jgi:hypothetical protein
VNEFDQQWDSRRTDQRRQRPLLSRRADARPRWRRSIEQTDADDGGNDHRTVRYPTISGDHEHPMMPTRSAVLSLVPNH